MKVKKFQAASMPEVMKKVKKELGPNAVILNSKVVKVGGFMGMFKKTQTEVIAAVEPVQSQPQVKKNTKPKSQETVLPKVHDQANSEIMKELQSLKAMVRKHEEDRIPEGYGDLFEQLLDQEVDEELAKQWLNTIAAAEGDPHPSGDLLVRHVYEQLKHLPFGKKESQKRFVHLVGPTGVGKTTTVAKLAADATLNKQWNVALITTDTYRIAAIDQLKTYAGILDLPLEVAYNMEDYAAAREKFKDYDLVLVDTAGRNFRDPSYVEELDELIDFSQDTDTYLVLSLTSKYKDMNDIYEQFQHLPIQQLIFTKMDETSSFGSALNMVIHHEVGIAYLTNGQDVPDDIIEATPMRLSRQVVGGIRL
ncbi:flagellar biosynthesis protein FlhF [Halobacillus locisalis]|uniref:Flagellar biosynthesis protein FlhF n=1 Tax=Halobacillus locisalis TaxID=220753 RepID=A0A838CQ59_9BACI|nr:flagellar biosynthesis protein FlhF [Halobacillus locisalis]MBA2174094.1 flagellar biosynthesis protein FlhF [Halobacillus locisalis]